MVGVNGEEGNDRLLISDCGCGFVVLFVVAGLTTLLLIILIDGTVGFDLVGFLPDTVS